MTFAHRPGPGRAARSGRRWWLAYGLSAALVVAGALVAGWMGRQTTMGWFAYSPSPTAEMQALLRRARLRLIAGFLVGAGLLLAAFVTGRILRLPAAGSPSIWPVVCGVAGVALVVVGVGLFHWLPGDLDGATALVATGAVGVAVALGHGGRERRPVSPAD